MDDFFKGWIVGFLIAVASLSLGTSIDDYEITENCAEYNNTSGIFKINNTLENKE